MDTGAPRYVEVQFFPWWANCGLLGFVPFVLILGLTQAGSKPVPMGVAVLIAVLLVGIFLLLFRMVTTVDDDRIQIEFGWLGLVRFTIRLADVTACRPVAYDPIGEFGGWGIRYGFNGKWAYSTRGNRAVEVITERRTVFIGTGYADRLSDLVNRLTASGTP